MREQLELLSVPEPAQPRGFELRCVGVADLLEDLIAAGERPALIVAEPPWTYSQAPGHSANPENHYQPMTDREICALLDRAFDVVEAGRLALWMTWPKLQNWIDAQQAHGWRWRYVSGGAWTKTGSRAGTGYHWLGASEPVFLYVKGSGLCTEWGALRNAHTSPRQAHSEKPVEWIEGWIERWTKPGDLVVDLFAGLGPVARACARTGRRYIGAELDPARHRQAVDRIALDRQNHR